MIYLLSTILYFSFAVHKLAKFSSNAGKLHFKGLVHILRYITENKTLGLNYYDDMDDAPVSDLLIKAIIKTENQLMDFSDSSWKIFQTLVEVQEYILYFIKVFQLTMAHMFQDQLLNQVQKVSTIQHAL